MDLPDDRVTLEWLILADAAQMCGNKLFLLGGGWDVLTVNSSFPVDQQLAIAAAFRVPWNTTNHPHNVEIDIVNEDRGETPVAQMAVQFEVGRPARLPPGTFQRAQVAATVGLRVEAAGLYVIRTRIDGVDQPSQRVTFRVVAGPALAANP